MSKYSVKHKELDTQVSSIENISKSLANINSKLNAVYNSISSDNAQLSKIKSDLKKENEKMNSTYEKLSKLGYVLRDVSGLYMLVENNNIKALNGETGGNSNTANNPANQGTPGTATVTPPSTSTAYANLKPYVSTSASYRNRDYSNYSVINGFKEEYLYNQKDKVNTDKFGSGGCTATSEAMAASMFNDKKILPTQVGWGSNGAKWTHSNIINNTKNCSAAETYKIIGKHVSEGTPVMFRVKTASNQEGHHLVAVGLANGADINNLKPSDLLIADPSTGKIFSMEHFTNNYSSQKLRIVDNQDWSLRIPK